MNPSFGSPVGFIDIIITLTTGQLALSVPPPSRNAKHLTRTTTAFDGGVELPAACFPSRPPPPRTLVHRCRPNAHAGAPPALVPRARRARDPDGAPRPGREPRRVPVLRGGGQGGAGQLCACG
ncbi:hypothetical protein BDZ89DRAFT_361951 [Hymenopellis radicata]|nr:hypothetical protein BDZ89DRAFT_361951 [Hymenopellis radicata]